MTDDQEATPDPVWDVDPNDASSAKPTDVLLTVGLLLVSPFLVDFPAFTVLDSWHHESVIMPLLLGIIVAKFGLMAMWLAWGGWRAVVRLLVIALSSYLSCFMVARNEPNTGQMFAADLLLMAVCGSMIAVPRLFGVRWLGPEDLALRTIAPSKKYQFSVFDMLSWTTTVAILVGLTRWTGMTAEMFLVGLIFASISCAMAAAGMLTAMWAQLTMAQNLSPRVLAAFGLALLMGSLLIGLSHLPIEAVFYTFEFFFTIAGCWLGYCHVLRLRGHRLVGRKYSPVQEDQNKCQRLGGQ